MSEKITQDEIRERLVGMVAHALNSPPEGIRCDLLFSKLELDSMAVVDISAQLETWLRMDIEPDIVWDHPTIDTMASHLAEQYKARASSS